MSGDLVPRQTFSSLFARTIQNIELRWKHVVAMGTRPNVSASEKREAIDGWLDACELALRLACPQLYDADGRPLK